MKQALLFGALTIYIGLCAACSTERAAAGPQPTPTPVPPTAEITQAAQEFLKSKPVASVTGVTLHRQTDDYYVVGADYINREGRSDVYQLIARRYTAADGHQYWKAEDLAMSLVVALDSNKDPEDKKP